MAGKKNLASGGQAARWSNLPWSKTLRMTFKQKNDRMLPRHGWLDDPNEAP
jgi:hypothetical protein